MWIEMPTRTREQTLSMLKFKEMVRCPWDDLFRSIQTQSLTAIAFCKICLLSALNLNMFTVISIFRFSIFQQLQLRRTESLHLRKKITTRVLTIMKMNEVGLDQLQLTMFHSFRYVYKLLQQP